MVAMSSKRVSNRCVSWNTDSIHMPNTVMRTDTKRDQLSQKNTVSTVTLSLCLINQAPRHEGVGGVEVYLQWRFFTILYLNITWRWVTSFTPQPLNPRRKSARIHWTRSWMGRRDGLNTVEKRKIFCPCRESNPGSQVRSPSLYEKNTLNF
jgi:hypothetical protein